MRGPPGSMRRAWPSLTRWIRFGAEEERQRVVAEELAAERAAAAAMGQEEALAEKAWADKPQSTIAAQDSGKGAIALAFAKKQLGKPYIWAAVGPGSHQCSGLTGAWRAAGISIPRVSGIQSTGAGPAVAKSDLRAGDLVFFYSPVSHVRLYVGNAMMINAPRPAKFLSYVNIAKLPDAGARGPG